MENRNSVNVKVPKKNGFHHFHRNLLTGRIGTLTPICCKELIPATDVDLSVAVKLQLPPLASDTFMRLKYNIEAFIIPHRILCGSFQSFFVDQSEQVIASGTSGSIAERLGRVPCLDVSKVTESDFANYFGPGTLADYLNCRPGSYNSDYPFSQPINLMPFLAYSKVWDDWYRYPLIQKSAFARRVVDLSSANIRVCGAPYGFFDISNYLYGVSTSNSAFVMADSINLFDLRQRNFDYDYFTIATPAAQFGSAMSIASGTSFTIASLRAGNSMQMFEERNNLSSPLFVDVNKNRYGAKLSNAVSQRCQCIGSASLYIDTRAVQQTADGGSGTSNPFSSVGATYGKASVENDTFICKGFEVNEPSYLMVIASLVPEVTYTNGLDRMFLRYNRAGSIVDMANPILQNIGNQPIYNIELSPLVGEEVTGMEAFGYTDRYADFKTSIDEVHGLMRAGQNLDSFALQRTIIGDTETEIGSDFLQIPKDYLKDVLSVASEVSGVDFWADHAIDLRLVMPIDAYSIPSLQDPAYEHGTNINLPLGGSHL